MRHRVKTVKFKYGRNADSMLKRKLLKNFIVHGRMTTTEKKIKTIKREVEKLIQYAKKNTEASRILLKSRLADRQVESVLVKYVTPAFKDRQSGFTTLVHLPQRDSDGATIARLQWSLPVVLEKPVSKKKKKEVKTETAKKEKVGKKSSSKKEKQI